MSKEINTKKIEAEAPEKKSILRVIVHSFFVVPFLIAIFAVIVYLMVRVLTVEPNTAQDYLEHVKIGRIDSLSSEWMLRCANARSRKG